MYAEIPLFAALLLVAGGLAALAWSSDVFVAGAAALARSLGISAFVVGMVVVGFGTSAPELLVSTFSGLSGHTNLSLGNAYGSCIFNIIGILGVAALIRPLAVKPSIRKVAVPLLCAITAWALVMLRDGALSRVEALALLGVFAVVMPLYCRFDKPADADAAEGEDGGKALSAAKAALWTAVGLAVMIGASHALVWGAVDVARSLGVSELLIGLTVVAIGTSIPELASAIAAARRNEAELVLGNIIGSNIFNMLAVVGIAGSISPTDGFSRYLVLRDLPLLLLATASIALFARRSPDGRLYISRRSGALWVAALAVYMAATVSQEVKAANAGAQSAAAAGQAPSSRIEWVVMGTQAAFQWRDDADRAKAAEAQAIFKEVETLLNAHDPHSELSRLAPLPDAEILARCSPLVRPCYEAAFRHRDASGGAFNPRWRGAGTMDLGAIAKGFALDLAAQRIGECDALLDLGGSVKTLGGSWKIGVYGSGETVELRGGGACATSGEYFRGRHIKDGRTGADLPGDRRAVTVCHPASAMEADALSTALFILGPENGAELLARIAPEASAVWCGPQK